MCNRHVFACALVCMLCCGLGSAEVCNVKVVTDASPDYSDMPSLVHSVTSQWPTAKEKCWAIYYWNHLGRRQTAPMCLHGAGLELTDPIRQFNDYGFAMCSTVAGINTAIWGNMGLKVKFWDISLHTVPEVEYDGGWHMYDNSLSALYTLCDGKTLAGVEDIGKEMGCPASGGRVERGHIALYHCLYGTSPNGFLSGADCPRSLESEGRGCFNPKALKFRSYFNNWNWGHRYILNLRENETYTRYYRRLDASAPQGKSGEAQKSEKGKKGKDSFTSDPAYFVPSLTAKGEIRDPESPNPRYHIRGNGLWEFRPALTPEQWRQSVHSAKGIVAAQPSGLQPEKAGQGGEAIFRVASANVTASQKVHAEFLRRGAEDSVKLSVSADNGLNWKPAWTADATGDVQADLQLIAEVNGAYEPMLKVELAAKANPADAVLKRLEIQTVTEVNSKTQPRLNLGKNTVFVGVGDPTESIVLWPDLRAAEYKKQIVEESNVVCEADPKPYLGSLRPAASNQEGSVVYRIDAPGDLTRLTYGGRFYNRIADGDKSYIRLLYSVDGKTWSPSWTLDHNEKPWDVIHYETVDLPKGSRSVWMKYAVKSRNVDDAGGGCSIYSLRMEANYTPPDTAFKPIVATFTWKEVQKDRSLVERSHTQLVERVPFTYAINVGGEDQPVMESLRTVLAGPAAGAKTGYSDGKDAGGSKFLYRWASYGRNAALGKKYTVSVPSGTQWNAGDPKGTKLTDGVVGPTYAGASAPSFGLLWDKGQTPEITVDLEKPETCAAFRVALGAGHPWWDALKGEVQDQVKVQTSQDGKEFADQGMFDFSLWRKDIPINYMLTDDESTQAFNFELALPKPVTARYVRFVLAAQRAVTISEVQVLDSLKREPFDIRIALPATAN